MRYASVPAQVTTVEDKIIGSLTLAQITLLTAPIFADFVVYAVAPKPFKLNVYKFILIFLLTSVFWVLSVRIKNKLLINWLFVLGNYSLRIRLYVFDKNTMEFRPGPVLIENEDETIESPMVIKTNITPVYFEGLDRFKLSFIEKKGKLHVYVTEN